MTRLGKFILISISILIAFLSILIDSAVPVLADSSGNTYISVTSGSDFVFYIEGWTTVPMNFCYYDPTNNLIGHSDATNSYGSFGGRIHFTAPFSGHETDYGNYTFVQQGSGPTLCDTPLTGADISGEYPSAQRLVYNFFAPTTPTPTPTPTLTPPPQPGPTEVLTNNYIFIIGSMGIFLMQFVAILAIIYLAVVLVGWPIKKLFHNIKKLLNRH